MTRFQVTNDSQDVVAADRKEIWDVITDPDLLAELTPLVAAISVDGDRWCWQLAGIRAMGLSIAPAFTERMTFTEAEEIRFVHDPPPGTTERAGADGVYRLRDTPDGTHLQVRLTVHVDLPLPRTARPAVHRIMDASLQRSGDRFARNLLHHLGIG